MISRSLAIVLEPMAHQWLVIDQERQTDDVSVPAGKLKAIRASTQVRVYHYDFAVVGPLWPVKAGSLQQQVVALHNPVDALVIDPSDTLRPQLTVRNSCDPAISIGWALCHQCLNARQDHRVLGFVIARRGFALPFTRSCKFERDTPSVAATAFMGYRPV